MICIKRYKLKIITVRVMPALFIFLFFCFVLNPVIFTQENINLSTADLKNAKELDIVLKSTSSKERLDGIYKFYNTQSDLIINDICNHYFVEKDRYVQKSIVEIVAYNTNIDKCREVILDAVKNDNEVIKNTAFLSANETMDKSLIKNVRDSIRLERKRNIKLNAILKLSQIDKSTEAVKLISDELLNTNDDDIIKTSLKGLDNIGTKEAKSELNKHSKSKNKKISDEAKRYLKK